MDTQTIAAIIVVVVLLALTVMACMYRLRTARKEKSEREARILEHPIPSLSTEAEVPINSLPPPPEEPKKWYNDNPEMNRGKKFNPFANDGAADAVHTALEEREKPLLLHLQQPQRNTTTNGDDVGIMCSVCRYQLATPGSTRCFKCPQPIWSDHDYAPGKGGVKGSGRIVKASGRIVDYARSKGAMVAQPLPM
eukprot:PhF_6_TR30081/c0_g1_i1/m.43918